MNISPARGLRLSVLLAALALPGEAVLAAGATIAAAPRVVGLVAPDDQGAATVSWDSKSPFAEVYLSVDNGPERLFHNGAVGESAAPWIGSKSVYEFRLYQGTEHKELLAAVQVTGKVVPPRSTKPVGHFTSVGRGYAVYTLGVAAIAAAILSHALWPDWPANAARVIGAVLRLRKRSGVAAPRDGLAATAETPGAESLSIPPVLKWTSRLACAAPSFAVLLMGSALGYINLWWLVEFRGEFPLDIDETQFITAGFDLASELARGGLRAFWTEFQSERWHGPLQPLATGAVTLAAGRDVFLGFVVVQWFLILMLFASYGIGYRLGGVSVGLLSALTVGTAPGVIYAGRVLFCTIPSSALLIVATWCLLRSERLDRLGWAVAFGLFVGLGNLSRPLSIFMAIGMFTAAAFQWIVVPGDRRRRLVHLLLSGIVALGISYIWYGKNFGYVWRYLTEYGYGRASVFEGEGAPPVLIGFLTYRIRTLLNQGFQAPLGIVLVVLALAGLAVVGIRRYRSSGWRGLWRSCTGSDYAAVAISTVAIYAILSTSRNEGDGFTIYIVPTIIALAIAPAWAVGRRWVRAVAGGMLVILALFNVVLAADVHAELSERRDVRIPWLGDVCAVDGWGRVHSLLDQVGYRGPVTTIPPFYRQWCSVNDEILEHIEWRAGGDLGGVPIVVGMRDPLISFATLRMFNRLHFQGQAQIHAPVAPEADLVKAYRRVLVPYLWRSRVYFVSAPPSRFEYGPIFHETVSEQAAASLDFKIVANIELPDGRVLHIWERHR